MNELLISLFNREEGVKFGYLLYKCVCERFHWDLLCKPKCISESWSKKVF